MQTGTIIAFRDQLILLALEDFLQTGDAVDVKPDADPRFYQVRKRGHITWFSIYTQLVKIDE